MIQICHSPPPIPGDQAATDPPLLTQLAMETACDGNPGCDHKTALQSCGCTRVKVEPQLIGTAALKEAVSSEKKKSPTKSSKERMMCPGTCYLPPKPGEHSPQYMWAEPPAVPSRSPHPSRLAVPLPATSVFIKQIQTPLPKLAVCMVPNTGSTNTTGAVTSTEQVCGETPVSKAGSSGCLASLENRTFT